MLRFATWKIVSIAAMIVVAILIVVPSFLAPAQRAALDARLPSWAHPKTLTLGLDLQGGSHILWQVDGNDVVKTMVASMRDDARRVLREEKVKITGGVGTEPRGISFRLADPADKARIMPKLQQLVAPEGGFLGGGEAAAYQISEPNPGEFSIDVTDAGVNNKIRRAVEQSIEVIRRRVDALGTTEPSIQREGTDSILVEVPGLQDPEELKKIVGTTAKLTFQLDAQPGDSPNDVEMLPRQDDPSQKVAVEKRVMVQGEDLTKASTGINPQTGQPVVNFTFNIRGGERFGQVTSQHVGDQFAIVLDGKVISDPRINTPITGGSGEISGNFTVQSANELALLLRAGALPAKLTITEERTVGPGLGQDSINAGKLAAYVSAALVFAYMLVTYGTFGIFANIALAVHISFIFAGLVLLGATLTLPGIAGIVLTIGMAVDSNVLIYERIREENHAGRSIIQSLDAGFKRAFATIVDSNVTMFVAAAILYFLGAGPVRGFAVSMGLGILTSIVTAVTMTQMMIALWYNRRRPTKLPI